MLSLYMTSMQFFIKKIAQTIDKRVFELLTLQFGIKPIDMANKTITSSSSRKSSAGGAGLNKMSKAQQPFSRQNYLFMAICGLCIIVGFLLMLGGGSSVEGGFNPDIFSFRRIVVGPSIALIGFLCMAFAILYRPANKSKKTLKDTDNGVD